MFRCLPLTGCLLFVLAVVADTGREFRGQTPLGSPPDKNFSGDPLRADPVSRLGSTLWLHGAGVIDSQAGTQPDKTESFKPLQGDVVAAWINEGARVGKLLTKPQVPLWFLRFVQPGQLLWDAGPGGLPTFQFSNLQAGQLAKLPIPTTAFGLYLGLGNGGNYGTVTDTILKELAGLKSLHTLILDSTPVTDAGLKELAALKSLQALNLEGTQVTDVGLKELAGLKSLQMLLLGNTKVTDAGLKDVSRLKSMQAMSLGTQVTDTGLKELAGLKNLHTLRLFGTKVTDAGLKELAGLNSLERLHLGATKVTDLGLKEIAGLKNLERLDLRGTQVTATGVKELQKALPQCTILR